MKELQDAIKCALHPIVWKQKKKNKLHRNPSRLSSDDIDIDDHDYGDDTLPTLVHVEPCMYTVTPDENFLIGTPDDGVCHHEAVFAVGGLSGHGFKMVPALGQMLADFALGRHNVVDHWGASFCSPTRFATEATTSTTKE